MEIDNFLSSGSPNIPGFAVMGTIEGVLVFYNDINVATPKVTHDWMKALIKENREKWDALQKDCLDYSHTFIDETKSFNQDSEQTEGMLLFWVFFVRFMRLHL